MFDLREFEIQTEQISREAGGRVLGKGMVLNDSE
jgi:hypothetical protein